MATVPTPNVAEVHVRGSAENQQVENLLFYELGTAITQAVLDTLVDEVSAAVIANWFPELSGDWEGREVYARDMTSGSGLQSTNNDIFGLPGTASGGALPNNSTIAVARKSGLAGRSFMGRIFWQSLATSQQASANFLDVTAANAIISAVEAVDAAAVAESWTPVIVSLFSLGSPRVSGLTTPITLWTMTDLALDSRRRRLPFRGI